MFPATPCSSSGESIVSKQPLVCVTLCRWPFRVQVGKKLSDLNTKRSPTQSDTYQRLFWYNLFSWWWARGCSKHVENWNKYIEKNCASSWSFTKNQKNIRLLMAFSRLTVWLNKSQWQIKGVAKCLSFCYVLAWKSVRDQTGLVSCEAVSTKYQECLYSCLSYPVCKSHLFCTASHFHPWPVRLNHIFHIISSYWT